MAPPHHDSSKNHGERNESKEDSPISQKIDENSLLGMIAQTGYVQSLPPSEASNTCEDSPNLKRVAGITDSLPHTPNEPESLKPVKLFGRPVSADGRPDRKEFQMKPAMDRRKVIKFAPVLKPAFHFENEESPVAAHMGRSPQIQGIEGKRTSVTSGSNGGIDNSTFTISSGSSSLLEQVQASEEPNQAADCAEDHNNDPNEVLCIQSSSTNEKDALRQLKDILVQENEPEYQPQKTFRKGINLMPANLVQDCASATSISLAKPSELETVCGKTAGPVEAVQHQDPQAKDDNGIGQCLSETPNALSTKLVNMAPCFGEHVGHVRAERPIIEKEHHYRVNKPQLPIKTRPVFDNLPYQQSRRPTQKQPSEEDLFFLLMHRSRQRTDTEVRLQAKYQELQIQNDRLSHENEQYEVRLRNALARVEKQQVSSQSHKTEIEHFKTVFTKFKDYAKGLGTDIEALKTDAENIHKSCDQLIHARVEINQDLQGLQNASTVSTDINRNLKSRIAELTEKLERLQRDLQAARTQEHCSNIQLERELVRVERLDNHVLMLQSMQNRHNLGAEKEQRKISTHLQHLSQDISTLQKLTENNMEPRNSIGTQKCSELLQNLTEKENLDSAALMAVKGSIEGIFEQLRHFTNIPNDLLRASTGANEDICNQVLTQITTLQESLHISTRSQAEFALLREQNARLEERLTVGKELFLEIRTGKENAEEKESAVRRTMEQLIAVLTEMQKTVDAREPVIDNRKKDDEITVWTTKWSQVNAQCAVEKERIRAKEQELEVCRLAVENLKAQLLSSENQNEDARNQLQSLEQKRKEEMEQYAQALQKARSETEGALQDHIKAQSRICELGQIEQAIAIASEEAARVPILLHQLECQAGELTELQQKSAKLQEIESQLVESQSENEAARILRVKLEEDLQEARKQSKLVPKMQQDYDDRMKQLHALEAQVLELDQIKDIVKMKEDKIMEQSQNIEKLQKKLDSTEALLKQISEFEEDAMHYNQKYNKLSKELNSAKSVADLCLDLQDKIQQKDEELVLMRTKIAATEALSDQLQITKRQNQEKDSQLAALQEKIAQLDVDSQCHAETQQKCTQTREDGLISQDTLLTFQEIADRVQDGVAHLARSGSITERHPEEGQGGKNQRRRANRNIIATSSFTNGTIARENQLTAKRTANANDSKDDPMSTQFIPDSQLVQTVEVVITTKAPEKHCAEDMISAPRPSSSYGEDMLLERIEDAEPDESQSKQQSGTVDPSKLTRSSQIVSRSGNQTASQTANTHINGIAQTGRTTLKRASRPSPRRLRSRDTRGLTNNTDLADQTSSSLSILPSSPANTNAFKVNNLPNSAAKRRVESIDETPSTSQGNKRLKRNTDNMQVIKSNRGTSSSFSTESPRPEIGRSARNMPSAARKGSIIGKNAPAPGDAQSSNKRTRKGSNNNRYSARFNTEISEG